jgi:hypothetical protein
VAGLLTYIAIFAMTSIWILGWMGLSVVIGSFFDLPLKTVSLVGATLGPLGFMVTIMLGILESSSEKAYETETVKVKVDDDPFGDVFK